MNKSMKITERTREILRAEKAAREKSNTFVSMVSLMEEAVVVCFGEPTDGQARQIQANFTMKTPMSLSEEAPSPGPA